MSTTTRPRTWADATANDRLAPPRKGYDTEVVLASELEGGDLITEVDTPDGPFYMFMNHAADGMAEVDGDPFDERPLWVSIPVRPTDQVRRAIIESIPLPAASPSADFTAALHFHDPAYPGRPLSVELLADPAAGRMTGVRLPCGERGWVHPRELCIDLTCALATAVGA